MMLLLVEKVDAWLKQTCLIGLLILSILRWKKTRTEALVQFSRTKSNGLTETPVEQHWKWSNSWGWFAKAMLHSQNEIGDFNWNHEIDGLVQTDVTPVH